MKIVLTITMLFLTGLCLAEPMSCNLSSNGELHVTMSTPHPEHALVHRPSGETVWLQTSPEFVHQQIENFGDLATWVIGSESMGTVWVNGKAVAQPILKGPGKYHLYVAENTETERENTYFVECYFTLGKNA